MKATRYTKLLEPCSVGGIQARNRIVMAAMGTNFATPEGLVTDRHMGFYEARARGGVGTIIVGCAAIHLTGKVSTNQVCVYTDEHVPGLAKLAATIRSNGAKAILQLQHGGRYCYPDRIGGNEPVAPSPIAMPGRVPPKELTTGEIATLVECFAQGAERAKRAGFDGVEVHAGHGYLLAQFISPASNKRRDAYGGDLAGRARIVLEIIEAVRAKVGQTYPVWCRIDGREFGVEGGVTPQDGVKLAQMLEESGVDAIHVSGYGGAHDFNFTEAMLVYEPGKLVPYAEGVKKAVKIPVIAVGRVSPEMAEQVLEKGQADLVAMARPLLADPDLPAKLAAGKQDEIRPCICCYTCIHKIFLSQGTACSVNAAAGREHELTLKPAEKKKSVVIVGGGPAGMEAACVASSRGHHVTLYEKGPRLGGSLFFASVLNPENQKLLDYLRTEIKKSPVQVRLRSEFTPALADGSRTDALIVAAGPTLLPAGIPGTDRKSVLTGSVVRQIIGGQLKANTGRFSWPTRAMLTLASPVLARIQNPSLVRRLAQIWMPLGKNVVVVGSDFVACELAEFLSHGRKVTLLSNKNDLAMEMAIPARWKLMESLKKGGVNIMTGVTVKEIRDGGVLVLTGEGKSEVTKADSVILTEEIGGNPELLKALQVNGAALYGAGDCNGLGLIERAIADGVGIASRI